MIALHTLNAGDKVLVKVGKNDIKAEVLEVRPDKCLVRNMVNGHEFAVSKVQDYLQEPAPEETTEQPAEDSATAEQLVAAENTTFDTSDAPTEQAAPTEAPVPAEPVQAPAAATAKPTKKMSLLDAAYNILLQEQRPMNTRELVKAAVEKGLWVMTSCKTPEQSLYGAIFLEMKKAEHPRFKKSVKRGAFEVAQ